MTTSLVSLILYVLISSFTPGPSNISSASMAVIHGYKKSIRFQTGLAAGVFFLMAVSGWFSGSLLSIFPGLEPMMRYAGAAYILYLAFGILKASYAVTEENTKPLGFVNGFVLQILNPKLIVYALTVFSGFLASVTTNLIILIVVAAMLAVISFFATSIWALFGTAIQIYLHQSHMRMFVNVVLSLSLVYTAITLTGLI